LHFFDSFWDPHSLDDWSKCSMLIILKTFRFCIVFFMQKFQWFAQKPCNFDPYSKTRNMCGKTFDCWTIYKCLSSFNQWSHVLPIFTWKNLCRFPLRVSGSFCLFLTKRCGITICFCGSVGIIHNKVSPTFLSGCFSNEFTTPQSYI
jgi:hypothetical protein